MTDDELDRRVRESLLAEEIDTSRVERAVRSQIHPAPRYVPRWAAVAAALVAMVAASTFSYRSFLQEKNTPAVCVAAARDHQREIVKGEPRPWLTDLPAIQALAEKQGVPASAIAGLAGTGYRLERARLCFLEKQIYLHLVYSKDATLYSVYLRPRSSDPAFSRSVRSAKVGAEDLAYFETNRLTAVFVSHTPGASPAQFASAGARVL
jgi:hypothetical protein